MERFCMLFERSISNFTKTSLKQHIESLHFLSSNWPGSLRRWDLVLCFLPKKTFTTKHNFRACDKRLTDKRNIYNFRTEIRDDDRPPLPCSGARGGSGGTRSGRSRPRPGAQFNRKHFSLSFGLKKTSWVLAWDSLQGDLIRMSHRK